MLKQMMIKLFLVCLVGIAAVQALDNEGGNNLRSKARELGFEQCLGKCVLNLFQSKECIECIRETDAFIIGDAQLPAGAIADLLQAKLGTGYTEMWCGEEDLPLGWRKEGNKYTGCEKTVDFPGNDATSHQLHSYVKSEMAKMPKLQYEGKIWRGNELGFIISNEKFTNEEIKPRSILLGSTVDQHIIIRPILDSFFGMRRRMFENGKGRSEQGIEPRNPCGSKRPQGYGTQNFDENNLWIQFHCHSMGYQRIH